MSAVTRLGQRAMHAFGLLILLVFSAETLAADNIWQSTFGQRWFYEVRSYPDQVLAGTWWEHSLTPGRTYRISFRVTHVKGRMGVLVGNNPQAVITQPGTYAYDFSITEGGKRRIIFWTQSSDVAAGVDSISVTEKWVAPTGTGNWLPKGHYLSFDRERNLKTQMDWVEQPWTAPSDYQLNLARNLDAALRTPGIKGVFMEFEWRSLETGDGRYNWSVLDANVATARKYGLKFIVEVADRSFDGTNVLPGYFPSQYVLWSNGTGNSGVLAKRWDPYVYSRQIRLYKAIANRYASDAGFGGIATAETATGSFSGGEYSIGKYRAALTQVVNQTLAALKNGKLFLYMNFLTGGESIDMNKDQRVALLRDVPHASLVVGGPDVSPDMPGMPRSVTAYRVHVRKHMPSVSQFCHLQHLDQGLFGTNVKNNKHRQAYFDEVARARGYEQQSWYKGLPGVYEFDDLRDPNGNKVALHPQWVLGKLWQPHELFNFGRRNFNCRYFFWHYREWARSSEFGWPDIRPVILNNQYL